MTYPFTAVLGADQMQLALVLNAVSPDIGGVLVRGEKGTAKSTAVRGLAALLPPVRQIAGCRFGCDPDAPEPNCPDGPHEADAAVLEHRPRLVELPVGASEDRLIGSLDLERALGEGVRAFEPGLLAAAHRGVLYVDEVNLLADHLVDVLLDAAAMGRNHVERDAVSVEHPARFVLIGSMNPEEGELRPQLLDRFGLAVDVTASRDPDVRVQVVRRRLAADADPSGFAAQWAAAEDELSARIVAARDRLRSVVLPDAALRQIAEVCAAFDVDGMRADIVTARAAVAHAAWHGRSEVATDDVRAAALLALPHRRRRNPFDEPGMDPDQLDDALDAADPGDEPDPDPDGPGSGSPPPDASSGETAEDQPAAQPEPAGASSNGPSNSSQRDSDDHRSENKGGDAPAQPAPTGAAGQATPLAARMRRRERGRDAATSGRRAAARTENGRATGTLPRDDHRGPLHLVATVHAAAPEQARRGRDGGPLRFHADDLRRAQRRGREGNLVLFVVDASGSMAARKRISEVKGVILGLLVDAYQRRDKVGMITFRGTDAEVVLPPTTSVEVAARRLDTVATGGRTPLAAGLARALRVIAAEQLRDPNRRPVVLVLTDGRADNAAALRAGAGLREHEVIVVDCEQGPVRLGLAGRLATELDAQCIPLQEFTASAPADRRRSA